MRLYNVISSKQFKGRNIGVAVSLIVFQMCFLLFWTSDHYKCVDNTLTAAYELKSGVYNHVLYIPGPFENGKRFKDYVQEVHPEVKFEVSNLWCSSLLTRL